MSINKGGTVRRVQLARHGRACYHLKGINNWAKVNEQFYDKEKWAAGRLCVQYSVARRGRRRYGDF
ncbi:MAG TPA: hypothetical protein VKH63_01990 [Candidatus Acidoferrum sp.]|nr:hypothetical protein [Candidatus Acidoferrum sp.]